MDTKSHVPYVGSGPYCYANSIAMMLGERAPPPSIIEFATSSPFGMQIIGSDLAFFDPYGWDFNLTVDDTLRALGWQSTLIAGKDSDDALARLTEQLRKGPVFVGPIDLGCMKHQPKYKGPVGADHFVVVLDIDESKDQVQLHDPDGYPFVMLPTRDLLEGWKCELIPFGKPYTMRTDFRQIETISEEDAIRRSIPNARRWLSMEGNHDMPPGSLGNGKAAERLADMMEGGFSPNLREMFTIFVIRCGARRLIDAATCLFRIGYDDAARIMAKQARLVGSLQYNLKVKDQDAAAAATMRELAATYDPLKVALEQ